MVEFEKIFEIDEIDELDELDKIDVLIVGKEEEMEKIYEKYEMSVFAQLSDTFGSGADSFSMLSDLCNLRFMIDECTKEMGRVLFHNKKSK